MKLHSEILSTAQRKVLAQLGPPMHRRGFYLVYFDDAEREPMPKKLWNVNWRRIREEIQNQVKTIAKRKRNTLT